MQPMVQATGLRSPAFHIPVFRGPTVQPCGIARARIEGPE